MTTTPVSLYTHLTSLAKSDAVALIVKHDLFPVEIRYQDLVVLLGRYAAFFDLQTLQPGDTVVSLLPNSVEAYLLYLACSLQGVNYAPLPCTATPGDYQKWCSILKPKRIFLSGLLSEELETAIHRSLIPTVLIATDTKWEWLPESTKALSAPKKSSCVYLSTSGSTGAPKAMAINNDRLWDSAHHFVTFHGVDASARFWNYLPMSYLGGLFNLGLIPLACKGASLIDEPFSGKTFLSYWATVVQYNINTLWLVPTIAKGLLELASRVKRDPAIYARLTHCFIGTAPIEPEAKWAFKQTFGIYPLENFGLSETTFISSQSVQDPLELKSGIGKVLPHVQVKLKPSEGDEESRFSEIWVKTPHLFEGYLGEDGILTLSLDEEGYFPTGDLGHVASDNTLVLEGRKRDIIKRGGYMVSLKEIEHVVQTHPMVLEAAAIAVPHSFYGESTELYLILGQDASAHSLPEITTWVHAHLNKYKWPDRIHVASEFPRTASGKIQKHLMKELVK